MLKLNLGAGYKKYDGFVSVDNSKECQPDVLHDLETFPYPFETNSVERIQMNHVLEHLGADPDIFNEIMREIYRICCDGAVIDIKVPHPRHEYYLGDPTHVRPITPLVMSLYDRDKNEEWLKSGSSNTPLAIMNQVHFVTTKTNYILEEAIDQQFKSGQISTEELTEMIVRQNNVVTEIIMELKVVKS